MPLLNGMSAAIELPPLWEHQAFALDELAKAEARRMPVLEVTPTGGGKTRVMAERAKLCVQRGRRCLIYTNRRILTNQAKDTLGLHGLEYGMLASGHGSDWNASVQIASMQTVAERTLRTDLWPLFEADEVMVDEAHSQAGPIAQEIIARHLEAGAFVWGPTATPIGKPLGRIYKDLIVAGTHTELRRCGALVPCKVFAPSEDEGGGVKIKRWKNERGDLFSQASCYAHVIEHWQALNPSHLPTLLWAPGKAESRWFCQEFRKLGIEAAHIDGGTSDDERLEIFKASKLGQIQLLSSCGVMKEGVDLPWIRHGILVQPCKKLKDFMQLVGRLMRASAGKLDCLLQDHSGAAFRHGSPNLDRVWRLGNTEEDIERLSLQQKQRGELPDPICCPKCRGVRSKGDKCPYCGYQHEHGMRMVLMESGELKPIKSDIEGRKDRKPHAEGTWKSCLYAGASAGWTVGQAAANYKRLTGKLPFGFAHVPTGGSPDWKRKVCDVYPHIQPKVKQA